MSKVNSKKLFDFSTKRMLCLCMALLLALTGCSASRPQTIALIAASVSASHEEELIEVGRSEAILPDKTEAKKHQTEYDLIYQAVLGEKQAITLRGVTFGDVKPILEEILEQPELFWLTGYETQSRTVGGVLQSITIEFKWCYQEIAQKRRAVAAVVNNIMSAIPANASEYEKCKLVHDYLVTHITYGGQSGQDIYAALVEGRCVCNGYAKAYTYLLRKLGISCDKINGTAENQSHAWNVAVVDGVTCYTDVTWDDCDKCNAEGKEYISYQWFNVSLEDIEQRHHADKDQPNSGSREKTYFLKEGAWLEQYTQKSVTALFQRQIERGNALLTLRCANQACYEKLQRELIEGEKIYDVLRQAGYCTNNLCYWCDDEMYLLSICRNPA